MAAATLKWRKSLRKARGGERRGAGELLPWWYAAQLRSSGLATIEEGEEEELPLPRIEQKSEWRRLALQDLKRRRAVAGDILKGMTLQKVYRTVWSDSEEEEGGGGGHEVGTGVQNS